MPFRGSGTDRYYYRTWRAEHPTAALVFLHGYGEHSGHYHRFAAQLSATGVDVWMPDHLGHGLTGPLNGRFGSVDALSEVALDLCQHVRRESVELPLVLGGHSLGGLTALLAAGRLMPRPRGLVLTGTPFDGLPDDLTPGVEPVMSLDASYLDALEHDPLGFDAAAGEADLWRAVDTVAPVLGRRADDLELPVLMINGEHDAFAPPPVARRWQQRFAHAELVIVPGGHHDIPNDVSHWAVGRHVSEAVQSWTGAHRAPEPVAS